MGISYPAPASEAADMVRLFLEHLRAPHDNGDVEEHFSALLTTYRTVSGETPWISSANKRLFALNGDAHVRFAFSVGHFLNGHAVLMLSERIKNATLFAHLYEVYLDGGRNSPLGSPARSRSDLIREYSVIGGLLVYSATHYPEDGAAGVRHRELYGFGAIQSENVEEALTGGSFGNADDLDALKTLARLIREPSSRTLGVRLLNMIEWSENGRHKFRRRFGELVREAASFDPLWSRRLRFSFDSLAMRAAVGNGGFRWEEAVKTEVAASAKGRDAVMNSVLAIVENGDGWLADRFMGVLDSWNWAAPDTVDALIHAAASQRMSHTRKQMIDSAMSILEKEVVDLQAMETILTRMIGMFALTAPTVQAELYLALLVDKLFLAEKRDDVLTSDERIEFASDLIKALTDLYFRIRTSGKTGVSAREEVLRSPLTQILKIAESEKLNRVRFALLNNALQGTDTHNWDGKNSAWRFLRPLADPAEKENIDNATDPWTYLIDYERRNPENGGGGSSGGTAPTPSPATPTPRSGGPRFSPAPFNSAAVRIWRPIPQVMLMARMMPPATFMMR